MSKFKSLLTSIVCLLFIMIPGCAPGSEHDFGINDVAKDAGQSPILTGSHVSGWVVYSDSVSTESLEMQIFLKKLDTGEIRQLTFSGNNSFPKWSPDGLKIVFVSHTKENSDDIYIMDKDGSNQYPLVATAADESFPDWSPDGTKIVFSSNQDGDSQIYIMEMELMVRSNFGPK